MQDVLKHAIDMRILRGPWQLFSAADLARQEFPFHVTLAAGFGGSRSTAKPDGFTKRPVGSLIAISEAKLAA